MCCEGLNQASRQWLNIERSPETSRVLNAAIGLCAYGVAIRETSVVPQQTRQTWCARLAADMLHRVSLQTAYLSMDYQKTHRYIDRSLNHITAAIPVMHLDDVSRRRVQVENTVPGPRVPCIRRMR